MRAGNVITALNISSTAVTVTPRRRKGINKSHIIGYKSKARSARGHETASKINHKSIFIYLSLIDKYEILEKKVHLFLLFYFLTPCKAQM